VVAGSPPASSRRVADIHFTTGHRRCTNGRQSA
jgi:hypothetical protein